MTDQNKIKINTTAEPTKLHGSKGMDGQGWIFTSTTLATIYAWEGDGIWVLDFTDDDGEK